MLQLIISVFSLTATWCVFIRAGRIRQQNFQIIYRKRYRTFREVDPDACGLWYIENPFYADIEFYALDYRARRIYNSRSSTFLAKEAEL